MAQAPEVETPGVPGSAATACGGAGRGAGDAVCGRGANYVYVDITPSVPDGSGSCTFAWSVTVPAGTAPGNYPLTFTTRSDPFNQSTNPIEGSVSVTVAVRHSPAPRGG